MLLIWKQFCPALEQTNCAKEMFSCLRNVAVRTNSHVVHVRCAHSQGRYVCSSGVATPVAVVERRQVECVLNTSPERNNNNVTLPVRFPTARRVALLFAGQPAVASTILRAQTSERVQKHSDEEMRISKNQLDTVKGGHLGALFFAKLEQILS